MSELSVYTQPSISWDAPPAALISGSLTGIGVDTAASIHFDVAKYCLTFNVTPAEFGLYDEDNGQFLFDEDTGQPVFAEPAT